jgi:hypothetical protein
VPVPNGTKLSSETLFRLFDCAILRVPQHVGGSAKLYNHRLRNFDLLRRHNCVTFRALCSHCTIRGRRLEFDHFHQAEVQTRNNLVGLPGHVIVVSWSQGGLFASSGLDPGLHGSGQKYFRDRNRTYGAGFTGATGFVRWTIIKWPELRPVRDAKWPNSSCRPSRAARHTK